MFHPIVEKEIYRENYLEAYIGYNQMILNALNVLLRIKTNPFHYDFKARYLHYELNNDDLKKYISLCSIKDMESLKEKYFVAMEWIDILYRDISKENILMNLESSI